LDSSKDVVNWASMQSYNTWDKSKIQACVCDPYYEGADCSLRQCPRGDNILTVKTGSSDQVNTVQTILIADDTNGNDPSGEMTLTFTDLYGGVWTTRPITIGSSDTNDQNAINDALQALPNQVIESVTVARTSSTGTDAEGFLYTITFTSSHNAGTQNLLKVNIDGCNRSGCTPIFSGVTSADDEPITVTVADATTTKKESAVCSEHGLCDTETGICNCFSGYYDEDCSKQTVLV